MGSSLLVSEEPGGARLGCRASSLYYCRTDRRYIVLDLERDVYLALDAAATDAAGGITAHPLAGAATGPPACAAPTTSLFEHPRSCDGRIAIKEVAAFWKSSAWAAWQLRRASIARAVAIIDRRRQLRRPACASFDIARARRAVSAFGRLRPWYPRHYLCLFDSLALLDFLATADLYPSWVFGVQEEPFEAHCWVQADGVVLSDSLESVSAFTPILIV